MLGLKGKLWEVTVEHAQKCATEKRICYYYSSQRKIGVVFNVVEQVLGLIISGCKYSPLQNLSDKDKVLCYAMFLIAILLLQHTFFFYLFT